MISGGSTFLILGLVVNASSLVRAFNPQTSSQWMNRNGQTISQSPLSYGPRKEVACRMAFGFGGGSSSTSATIPSSTNIRDSQAINGIKAAVASPRNPSMPLIECEFPALQALNKLGDGSLRSTREAEQANLAFASKVLKALAPLPFLGPKTWLLVSSSSSNAFLRDATSKAKNCGARIHSLRDGLPPVDAGDVCLLVTPSVKSDYDAAQTIATSGEVGAVIVQNGFAKNPKSIPATATMAYFLKPLTYNSQVAGFLLRQYPGKWSTVDAVSKQVLGTCDDSEILVKNTNTPDLRPSGRLVQKSVDDRAIQARKK